MTILEQTEQALESAYGFDTPSETLGAIEKHARILAARMDAILAALKPEEQCPTRKQYGEYHRYVMDAVEWERKNAPYLQACAIADGKCDP